MAINQKILDFEYEKRGLTENIILKVATNDASLLETDPEAFLHLVEDFSDAETVGMQGMCLGNSNPEVSAFVPAVRAAYPGVRFRQIQMAKVMSVGALENVSDDYAESLLQSGSIAVFATEISDEALATLLAHGILSVLSNEPLEVGTTIFIKGIVNDIKLFPEKLTAYVMTDHFEPISLKLPDIYKGQETPYNLDFLNPLMK